MKKKIKGIYDISKKENNIINKVLSNYEFNVISISKVRGVYKVKNDNEYICLKTIKHNSAKVTLGYNLVKELNKNNFNNTLQYIKTKNNKLLVNYGKYKFYCTSWIDGVECSFQDFNEAKNCVKLLAEFHSKGKNINLKHFKIRNHSKNWSKNFNKKLYDMDKFKKIIERKMIKNEFDIRYYEFIDNFYNSGLIASKLLNSSEYTNLDKHKKTICHNSFYYQNVIKKDNKYYIIDFDSISEDLRVYDLGKFLRRLMQKKDYIWNFDKAKKLIEIYNSINPLSKEELKIMLSLIIFPYKFWKIGNKRYKKHKNWSETKYLHKLNKIIKYQDYKNLFIESYLEYLNTIE